MQARPDLVPAEQQHREEAGLKEEREDALSREGAPENVADVPRIRGPVGAELELHHDSGGHADGESQREDLRPEPRHLVIEWILRLQPQPLDHYQQQAEPDAQRRVEVMERDRQSELQAGEKQDVHGTEVKGEARNLKSGGISSRRAGGPAPVGQSPPRVLPRGRRSAPPTPATPDRAPTPQPP